MFDGVPSWRLLSGTVAVPNVIALDLQDEAFASSGESVALWAESCQVEARVVRTIAVRD